MSFESASELRGGGGFETERGENPAKCARQCGDLGRGIDEFSRGLLVKGLGISG